MLKKFNMIGRQNVYVWHDGVLCLWIHVSSSCLGRCLVWWAWKNIVYRLLHNIVLWDSTFQLLQGDLIVYPPVATFYSDLTVSCHFYWISPPVLRPTCCTGFNLFSFPEGVGTLPCWLFPGPHFAFVFQLEYFQTPSVSQPERISADWTTKPIYLWDKNAHSLELFIQILSKIKASYILFYPLCSWVDPDNLLSQSTFLIFYPCDWGWCQTSLLIQNIIKNNYENHSVLKRT